MDSTLLGGFVLAALIVLVIPGPGVAYVVTRSLSQGKHAGLISAAGLSAGALVHAFAAAAGLSAVLLASATAFGFIKLLGAGYLVYLGIRAIWFSRAVPDAGVAAPEPLRRVFLDGVLVSILNPKIAVFFLAFLPQFVVPESGAVSVQLLVLGLIYALLALVTDSVYALSATGTRKLLGTARLRGPILSYLSGLTYIGLGIGLVLADRRS